MSTRPVEKFYCFVILTSMATSGKATAAPTPRMIASSSEDVSSLEALLAFKILMTSEGLRGGIQKPLTRRGAFDHKTLEVGHGAYGDHHHSMGNSISCSKCLSFEELCDILCGGGRSSWTTGKYINYPTKSVEQHRMPKNISPEDKLNLQFLAELAERPPVPSRPKSRSHEDSLDRFYEPT